MRFFTTVGCGDSPDRAGRCLKLDDATRCVETLLYWMDARSGMRDDALFYLKKLWGHVKQHGGLTRGADAVLEEGRRDVSNMAD